MNIQKNTVLKGRNNTSILVDVFYKATRKPKPVLLFCHGYKGFKDWGAWNVMAEAFAEAGFFFVKFNFSHSGGTVEEPIDFPDLEAFGNNNYSKELDDLTTVIDWLCIDNPYSQEQNNQQLALMGHSRGGGIVSIKAAEDTRVSAVISLAGVSDFKSRFPKKEDLEKWKEKGVYYVKNGRTHQEMPHFYQFFEDFQENEIRLTIKNAVQKITQPHLILHGDADTSVSIEEAKALHEWSPKSQVQIFSNTDHVFGAKHPWTEKALPVALKKVVALCVSFLK